ncbi:hypothetical protein [Sphingomonas sp. YR710]|uniref:hypothetical protein n=1 Tax=Sphingomonas sp. YR710 TaxID=1882773 RepID=UPI000B847D2A|nr:hypothetical protein [Sphingomonas sp. YR710]
MGDRQFRRPRPTLETAHGFRREGLFGTGPDHWLSDEDRIELWRIEGTKLLDLAQKQFPRTQNLEFAILKGHLIIEHALLQFIRCHARVLVDEATLRFSFSQKLEVAYLMGFGVNEPALLPSVQRWNKVRNLVAHGFTLDRTLVDEMIRVHAEDYDGFSMTDNRQRITMLRSLCRYIAAWTAAHMDVHVYNETRYDDDL